MMNRSQGTSGRKNDRGNKHTGRGGGGRAEGVRD